MQIASQIAEARYSLLRGGGMRRGILRLVVLVLMWTAVGGLSEDEESGRRRRKSANSQLLFGRGRKFKYGINRKVTVIVTTCGEPESLRFHWLLLTLRTYLSREYDDLVYKILLVWNSKEPLAQELRFIEDDPTGQLHADGEEKLIFIEAKSNSLNNRWIQTIPYIETDLILNIDDDILALKPAIECMIANSYQANIASPFARTIGSAFNYSLDDRIFGVNPDYAILLPRVMLLHRKHFEAYARAPRELLKFVDSEPSHSDDILLNFLIQADRYTQEKKFLRLFPPSGSIVDYDKICNNFVKNRGLGTSRNRGFDRTSAARTIGLHYTNTVKYYTHSSACELVRLASSQISKEQNIDDDNLAPRFRERHQLHKRKVTTASVHQAFLLNTDINSTIFKVHGYGANNVALRSRPVRPYEHHLLYEDMYTKLRLEDADSTAKRVCLHKTSK